MKRKLFATFSALIAVFCCAFGLTACGDKAPELSPLQKAYQAYLQTPNMTVTVTNTHAEENVYNSVLVEIDHSHNAGHILRNGFEYYYETADNNGNPEFITYSYSQIYEDGILGETWHKFVEDNFYNEEVAQYYTLSEYKIYYLNMCASNYLPTHFGVSGGFRENENDDFGYASLQTMLHAFTESENGYSANIFYCDYDDEGGFTLTPCVATYKLDAEGRFESLVIDLGESGEFKVEFTYGTATVIIPDNVKNG